MSALPSVREPPSRSKNSPAMPIRSRGIPSPCGRCCGAAETRPARARPGEVATLFSVNFFILFLASRFFWVGAFPVVLAAAEPRLSGCFQRHLSKTSERAKLPSKVQRGRKTRGGGRGYARKRPLEKGENFRPRSLGAQAVNRSDSALLVSMFSLPSVPLSLPAVSSLRSAGDSVRTYQN